MTAAGTTFVIPGPKKTGTARRDRGRLRTVTGILLRPRSCRVPNRW